jgi:hypothetical protein
MVGEVIEDRTLASAVRVTEIRQRTIKVPLWYLNLKY